MKLIPLINQVAPVCVFVCVCKCYVVWVSLYVCAYISKVKHQEKAMDSKC